MGTEAERNGSESFRIFCCQDSRYVGVSTFVIQSRGGGMEGVARILLNTLIWQEENLPAKSHGVSKECHMG